MAQEIEESPGAEEAASIASQGGPWRFLPFAAFAGALATVGSSRFAWSDFPLDDAWIHRVYARSFAHGQGFAYQPGQVEAGSTSPLWAVVSAPLEWLAPLGVGAVVIGVKLLGVLLVLAFLDCVRRIGLRLGLSPILSASAAALVALDPRLAFDALSGMETPLLLALWAGGVLALMGSRFRAAALCLGLAVTTRPEAVVLLPLFALGVYLLRGPWKTLGIACLPAGAWSLFCLAASGHPLPTTFYVKGSSSEPLGAELSQVGRLLAFDALLPVVCVVALATVFLVWMARRSGVDSLLASLGLVALPLSYVGGVVFSRSVLLDGYYWTRWTEPGSLVLVAAACLGLALLVRIARDVETPSGQRVAAWGLVALTLGPALFVAPASYGKAVLHAEMDGRSIRKLNVAAGQWVAEHTGADALVGVNDAGAIRYFGGRKTVDLIGLNNQDIAFRRVPPSQVYESLDFLVVAPGLIPMERVGGLFEEQARFELPMEEYTICPCPDQSRVVAFARSAADAP